MTVDSILKVYRFVKSSMPDKEQSATFDRMFKARLSETIQAQRDSKLDPDPSRWQSGQLDADLTPNAERKLEELQRWMYHQSPTFRNQYR